MSGGIFTASIDDMLTWSQGVMQREPDFIIGPGDPDYIRRWWVIPRNDMSNVYLHLTQRDDDDRALHDHPWPSRSVILQGGYIEITPDGDYPRYAGDVINRAADAAHRLELHRDLMGNPIPCVSLFITGAKEREWGFHCPQGWRHWKDFTGFNLTGDSASIGLGCGEAA